jgi:diacylglycerol O-acyltransferase / wax synthase
MEVALVELGSLMLRASQRTNVLPNMGLVLRFSQELTAEELQAECDRLASSPYALGRRLAPPRVPGARPRWVASPHAPRVALAPRREDARALGMWLADEMSVRHDPEHDHGWRFAATRDADGATVVAITLNHLFGTGRDLATTAYGGLPEPNGDAPATYDVMAELRDAGGRLRRGGIGLLRLARDAALTPVRRAPYGDLAHVGKALAALRDRKPDRGRPSARRVGAVARADASAWAKAAKRQGATGMALQLAVVANLLRAARRARGDASGRPIRLIVPVDLANRREAPRAAATVGPVRLTSATVVLPGGAPRRDDLAEVQARLRRAVDAAVEEVKITGQVPVAPGVIDAARLLPDALTARIMFGVHSRYDGAASNVGPLPPGMLRIGEHVATDAFLMAFPLGSDLAIGFGRHEDAIALGAVADPSRLGAGPPLRERIAHELSEWDVPAAAW